MSRRVVPLDEAEGSAKAAEVRARTVEAAMVLFRTRGYDATTLGDIAAAVDLTGPALYYYFGSKANLLFEALRVPMTEQIERTRAATAGLEPAEQVVAFVETLVRFVLDNALLQSMHGDAYVGYGVLVRSLPDEQAEAVLGLLRTQVRDLRAIIAAGIRSGAFRDDDPTALTFAVLGIAENVTWHRPGGALSRTRLAELYGRLALSMLEA